MAEMQELQAEVQQLLDRKYQKANSELQATYQQSLKPLLSKLSKWVDNYSKLTFSQQREFEKNLSTAKIVSDIADGVYKDANGNLTAMLNDVGKTAYSGQIYAFEQSEDIDLNFQFIDDDEVRSISEREINGQNFSQRLYKNTNKLARNVHQSILDGLWQGNGYKEIASRLTELSEADYKRSERIARTEMGRVQSEATEKAYDNAIDQGVKMHKQWLATLSIRTRDDHAKLDGQQADDDGYFHIHEYKAKHPHGFGVASEDINCRCTTIAVVGGVEPELRRDEKNKKQVAYKNYDEWLTGKKPVKQAAQKSYIDPLDQSKWPKTVKDVKVMDGEYAVHFLMNGKEWRHSKLSEIGNLSKKEMLQGFGWAGKTEAEKTYNWYNSIQKYAVENPATSRNSVKKTAKPAKFKPTDEQKYDWDSILVDHAKEFGTDKINELKKYLNKAPEAQQKLIAKFAGQTNFSIGGTRSYYSPRENKMYLSTKDGNNAFATTEKGSASFEKPFQTYFHELAHNIDRLAKDEYIQYSKKFENKKGYSFKDVLMDDLKNFYDSNIEDKGFGESIIPYDPVGLKKFVNQLEEKGNATLYSYSDISDLNQGFTEIYNLNRRKKYQYASFDSGFVGGHRKGYFVKNPGMLEAEAFAEITAAYAISSRFPMNLETLKKEIPNVVKFYDEMVESIVKD